MASRLLASILVVALAAPLSATAAVKPVQSFRTDYAVSFLGFTVARTTFVSHIGADSYAIDGSINSAGLATFFSDLEARTAVSGRIAGGTFTPDSYSTDYKYGKKSKRTLLTFAKGKIANLHAEVAHAYADAGMLSEAMHELRKAVLLCPTFADLRLKLANLYKQQGDLSAARYELEEALIHRPNYVPAHVALGVVMLSQGDSSAARSRWEKALAIDPEDKSAKMYLRMVPAVS